MGHGVGIHSDNVLCKDPVRRNSINGVIEVGCAENAPMYHTENDVLAVVCIASGSGSGVLKIPCTINSLPDVLWRGRR